MDHTLIPYIRERFEALSFRETLKKLINHKNPQDVTGRYIVLDIEELREPMEQITEELWSQMK